MNWLILIAGIVALAATVGHFTMGRKMFLKPMMDASFDQVSKKVMHSVFHYVSVFQILSAAALLAVGTGCGFFTGTTLLVWFIALNYSLFALVGIVIAFTSGVPNGIVKMFQWGIWAVIAALGWAGV